MEADAEGLTADNGEPRVPVDLSMSAALSELERALRAVQAAAAAGRRQVVQMPASAEQVRAMIQARQRRSLLFGPDLFSDPAWEILLELYACNLEHRLPSISELTLSVGVPGTTVLRWLDKLDHQALITRRDDPRDIRKVRVGLSEYGRSQMTRYLAEGADGPCG